MLLGLSLASCGEVDKAYDCTGDVNFEFLPHLDGTRVAVVGSELHGLYRPHTSEEIKKLEGEPYTYLDLYDSDYFYVLRNTNVNVDGYLRSGYVFTIYKRSLRFEGRYEVRDSDTSEVSVLNKYEGRCRELE